MKSHLFLAVLFVCIAVVLCNVGGCEMPQAASEDRGSWGDLRAAVDVDINFDGRDRQSQPHVDDDTNPDVAALDELVDAAIEEGDERGVVAKAVGPNGSLTYIMRDVVINITGGSEASSRDSGGQNAEGPRTSAAIPIQANTGGAAGAQGDTSNTNNETPPASSSTGGGDVSTETSDNTTGE